MTSTHTLIIGASAAGLAAAACLKKAGVEFIILEKHPRVAMAWRNHYDRLHLHTSRKWSALPFKPFHPSLPQYPSRQDVVDYLDNYAKEFNISPAFDTEVISLKNNDNIWITETSNGSYKSSFVIVATGRNHKPKMAEVRGLSSFSGTVLHSSQYKNGKPFVGKNVLVVGFGNSAGEQAICLHEHGAFPSLSVRSAVNIIPQKIFGLPALEIGKLTSPFPTRIRDKINGPLLKLLVGDITKLGLKKSPYGPLEQIEKERKIPLLDIGTIKLIKQGHIKVYGDIVNIEGNTIYFESNKKQNVDTIILATGYHHNLQSFMDLGNDRINDLNNPIDNQSYFGTDGLYFCGFYVSPKGMLHEMGIEAARISEDIKKKVVRAN